MTWRTMGGAGSTPSSPNGLSGGQPSASGQPAEPAPVEENEGWNIFSYLIAGMVVYGLVGWLLAWLVHIPVLVPVGALVGLVFAIGGVVWKYGRHQ
jgi:F0F1-type ATP synthase assembly protein I